MEVVAAAEVATATVDVVAAAVVIGVGITEPFEVFVFRS